MTVELQTTPIPGGSWRELMEHEDVRAVWSNSADELFRYTESLTACTLERRRRDHVEPPADALEGRLFDDRAELRWIRRDNEFEGWLTREAAGGERVERLPKRRYCLIGVTRGASFTEGRFPGLDDLSYPVSAAEDDLRAYIEVYEYTEPAPSAERWAQLDTDEVEATLNTPRIAAHRFAGIGVGVGWKDEP